MNKYQIINQNLNDLAKVGVEAIVINTMPRPQGSTARYDGKIEDPAKADTPLYASAQLGTPVYSDLDTQSGTYTDDSGNTVTFPALRFETVLFVVNMSKNIVMTNIQGRNGSVKEYISDNDYQITIQGTIVGGNNIYPKDNVDALKKVLDAPVAIKVNSWFLVQLGISSIVVKDYTFPQVAGRNSQQEFSISAVSDTPVILQIR